MSDLDHLIDRLSGEAAAVQPMKSSRGRLLLAAVAALSVAMAYEVYGLREDVMAMNPPPMLAVSLGLFAILAIAAGSSAVRMARPQVGAGQSGAPWALAATMLLPLTALISLYSNPSMASGLGTHQGMRCLTFGLVTGSATLAFLTLWLRKGAPVAPERSAWFAGLAAGAVGAFANSLECPVDSIAHLGLWHVGEVILGGLIGRLVLPPLLRW